MLTKPALLAVALTVGALSLPSAAAALTLTNKSKQEHTIGVDRGAKEEVVKVAAGASVEIKDCDDGCGVTGPWNYTRMLKAGDKIDFDGTSPVRAEK